MSAARRRHLQSAAGAAIACGVLLGLGCSGGGVGPESSTVSVAVSGRVGLAGEWLSGVSVELGSFGDILDPDFPHWRALDATTTSSTGEYALEGRMAAWLSDAPLPGCFTAEVHASFPVAPDEIWVRLPGRTGACEGVQLQADFPVRRTHVVAGGRMVWADGTVAQGIEVVLKGWSNGPGEYLDRSVTDADGGYRLEAEVLDALCDPGSEFHYGATRVLAFNSEGLNLAFSEPVACGLNEMNLIATPPS